MSESKKPYDNNLLQRLPRSEFMQLSSLLERVKLPLKKTLFRAHGPIDYAYFPLHGAASVVNLMEDGFAVEVGTVGNEGMVGLPLILGVHSSPAKVFIQVEGSALRISATAFLQSMRDLPTFRNVLLRYTHAFQTQVAQTAACNTHHKIRERCCRWLLITRDRVNSTEIPLTHDLLSIMLGVRRPSITEVLSTLQADGLITYRRGKIFVKDSMGLESAACECYKNVIDEYNRTMDSQ